MNKSGCYWCKWISFQAVNRLKLGKLAFRLTARHRFLKLNPDTVTGARRLLERASPNPGTSCITENQFAPEVDLQIIVPAYNVEKYIRKCLESALAQNFPYTWRLVVVNDGSTDGTGDILREYEGHPNIRIIWSENRGLSGARNRGLAQITGKYVMFLDADDYLGDLKNMLDIAFETGADVVEGAYVSVWPNGKVRYTGAHIAGPLNPLTQLGGMAWRKLMKGEYFRNICFPQGYWFEDSLFQHILYPLFKQAQGVSDIVYYYLANPRGISATSRRRAKAIDSFWITEQLFQDRKKLGIGLTQEYYEYILWMVQLTYLRTMYLEPDVRRAVFIVFADFVTKNFPGYESRDEKHRMLEKALKEGDFGYYQAVCSWL